MARANCTRTKIVCVCTGTKYGPEYPFRLLHGLRRNTTVDFDFEIVRESIYAGWWSKMEIFPPKERIVYLDIDSVITANCDFLFDYDGDFIIGRDPYDRDGYDASVMGISAGYGAEMRDYFERFSIDIRRDFRSDQEFIESQVDFADIWQDLYPGKIRSYKADVRHSGLKGASIVSFHGLPKPHEIDEPWIQQHWR